MAPKFIIALLLTSLFLANCSSNDDRSNEYLMQDIQIPKSDFPPKVISHLSIYGTWSYDFPFYSSELTMKENGTFTFHDQGCLGHGYSEGVWINSGETYILTSFAKYKEPRESKVETIVNSVKNTNKTIKSNPNDSLGLVIQFPEFTMPDVTYKVSFPDTSNIYYDRVVFRLLNDTLYRLDKLGITTEAKLVISKNYR